jgi:4-diphosphocytidyl-2-C-methyl-D-erythritol kinase
VSLELLAPAKLNLCLEVLSRRADGYHEVATVMQTLDLADSVRLRPAPAIELSVTGDQVLGVPLEGPRNLAYKAAVALAAAAGRADLGAEIVLEKRIPAGMGLAGGSTDAAAVLRGLNQFWDLGFDEPALESVAAGVGSDVAFFLHGGTALAAGRGERVEALPDLQPSEYVLFTSPTEIEDKTRRMYALLTPSDFSDGHKAEVAAAAVRRGLPLAETDYANAFDRHIGEVAPHLAAAMAYCRDAGLRVLTAGSGPGFFSPLALSRVPSLLLRHLEHEWGVAATGCRSLDRARALAVRTL